VQYWRYEQSQFKLWDLWMENNEGCDLAT
jgi:hypothetical protein